jgi:hypothetical protein
MAAGFIRLFCISLTPFLPDGLLCYGKQSIGTKQRQLLLTLSLSFIGATRHDDLHHLQTNLL